MSVIALPDFLTGAFRWRLVRNEVISRSLFGSQTFEASVPQWAVDISGTPLMKHEAPRFEAFMEALAGSRNQVEIYHRAHPVPQGTMRGALTMLLPAVDGAITMTITGGTEGQTLLKGDLLGVGTGLNIQVVRVAADAVADTYGNMPLTLNHPIRGGVNAGEPVRWDRPAALFRQQQNNTGLEYTPGSITDSWTLSFLEDPRP